MIERLHAEHRLSIKQQPGGAQWFCSCGKAGDDALFNHPTYAQARARGDRHLRAERVRILREQQAQAKGIPS
jgi:hypothetical protein